MYKKVSLKFLWPLTSEKHTGAPHIICIWGSGFIPGSSALFVKLSLEGLWSRSVSGTVWGSCLGEKTCFVNNHHCHCLHCHHHRHRHCHHRHRGRRRHHHHHHLDQWRVAEDWTTRCGAAWGGAPRELGVTPIFWTSWPQYWTCWS